MLISASSFLFLSVLFLWVISAEYYGNNGQDHCWAAAGAYGTMLGAEGWDLGWAVGQCIHRKRDSSGGGLVKVKWQPEQS